jgi:hypothetical protein
MVTGTHPEVKGQAHNDAAINTAIMNIPFLKSALVFAIINKVLCFIKAVFYYSYNNKKTFDLKVFLRNEFHTFSYTRTALTRRIPAELDSSLVILKTLPPSASCAVWST